MNEIYVFKFCNSPTLKLWLHWGRNKSKQRNPNLKPLLLNINSGKRCEDHISVAKSQVKSRF